MQLFFNKRLIVAHLADTHLMYYYCCYMNYEFLYCNFCNICKVLRFSILHLKCHPVSAGSHDAVHPVVIVRHVGVHAILPLFGTFLPPAHDARQEPRVADDVCVRAPAVPLTGVSGPGVVPGAEHDARDGGAAAALALGSVYEGNLHLLQRFSRVSEVEPLAPAAHCRWGGLLQQGLGESARPHADGPRGSGEGDGFFRVEQGDVVVVHAYAGIVLRVYVLLQHVVVLLCALLDVDVVLACKTGYG